MPETTNDHPAPTPDALSALTPEERDVYEKWRVLSANTLGLGSTTPLLKIIDRLAAKLAEAELRLRVSAEEEGAMCDALNAVLDANGGWNESLDTYAGNFEHVIGGLKAKLAEAEKSDRERFAQVSRLTARLLAAEARVDGEGCARADYVRNLWLDALGGASVRLTGKPLDVSVGETDEESIGATVGRFVDRVEEVMSAQPPPAGDGRDKLRKAEKSRDYYIAESYKLKTDRDALAAQQPSADANVNAVVAKHRERAAKGLKKYGVTTERTDLSAVEWMRHFQEEAMDAAVYAERWIRDQADQAPDPAHPSPAGDGWIDDSDPSQAMAEVMGIHPVQRHSTREAGAGAEGGER